MISVKGVFLAGFSVSFDETDLTHRTLESAHITGSKVCLMHDSQEISGFVTRMDTWFEGTTQFRYFEITT